MPRNDSSTASGSGIVTIRIERKCIRKTTCASVTSAISSISACRSVSDGLLDQRRPVVERNDRDACREARLDLRDARLDRVDDLLRVHAAAGDDDAADGFLRALDERGHAKRVAELHVRHLLDVDRHAVRRADHDLLDVVDRCDQADAAHDQPGAVRIEHVAADIQVAVADGGDDGARAAGCRCAADSDRRRSDTAGRSRRPTRLRRRRGRQLS